MLAFIATKWGSNYLLVVLPAGRRGSLSLTKPKVLTYLSRISFGGLSLVATRNARN